MKTYSQLKETSTLKANGRLTVGNTVLFQISVESPAMRYHYQEKLDLPITYIELYRAMLKQKILPVSPLIQCEAGRAKTKLFALLGLKMAAV